MTPAYDADGPNNRSMRRFPFRVIASFLGIAVLTTSASAQTCASYVGQQITPVGIGAALAAVARIPQKKDEFESTAQFSARTSAATATVSRLFVVSTPLDPQFIKYDADAQQFDIASFAIRNLNTDWDAVFGYDRPLAGAVSYGPDNLDVVVQKSEAVVGRYRGGNAYGASTTIVQIKRTVKAIFDREAKDRESLFFDRQQRDPADNIIAHISVASAKASLLRNSMRAALVVAPKAPWFASGVKQWGDPTIDDPREIREEISALIADIQCALITDGNGTVLVAVTTR